jgi:hypothetical protein
MTGNATRSAGMMRYCAVLLLVASCRGASDAPTAPSSSPSAAPSVTSGGGSETFAVDLPVSEGDVGSSAYGIWPFGVHGGSHAVDGHPGWDVELRPGAQVLAAADGTIQHAVADAQGRLTVRIDHSAQGRYATDYTNLSDLAAGIAVGARVTRGQPLGSAGVQTQFIGTSQVTWAMSHFQVNDFGRNEGLTNPNAVSPEAHLTSRSRVLFDVIWRATAFRTEWCEPFPTNSRLAGFPIVRRWTLRSGTLPASLEVRCVSESSADYEYTSRYADGTLESGVLSVDATAKPLARVDMRPSSGASRLGVYNIVSGTMELSLGAAGAARSATLADASVYSSLP